MDGDVNEYVDKDEYVVGHSPQTRLFAPAATFARAQHRNILQGLTSPPLSAKPSEAPLLAHRVG